MKILFASKYVSVPPSWQLPRNYFLMRELSILGHDVNILTSTSNHFTEPPNFRGLSYTESIDGIKINWIKTIRYFRTNSIRRMLSWIDFEVRLVFWSLLHKDKYDVIICSSLSIFTILTGLFLRLRFGGKLVFEVRDIWPLTLIEEGGYSTKNPFIIAIGWIEKIGYKYSDLIVGTMPKLDEHVFETLGETKEVICIPMGWDKKHIQNVEKLSIGYKERYLQKPNTFKVMHLGSVGITNALENFVALARKFKSVSDVEFIVVGQGDLSENFREHVNDMPNIVFAEKVPKEQVQSVLSEADLLVFCAYPSKVWRYGQSLNKLIDYMLAGKPILGLYDGYPSMINEARCGKFVKNANIEDAVNYINECIEMGPDARMKLGKLGRDWLLTHRSYKTLAKYYEQQLIRLGS